MRIAPLPADETQRLEALRALQILDTPPEERFDRITRLAQRLFDVPIATVTLIDANRQWFKSKQGLENSESTRDVAFCAHTILQDDAMVVPDTLQDDRFHDNPLVTGAPNIRFYAGHPLHAAKGERLGTFCIIDRKPRELDKNQLMVLRDLAALAETELNALPLREALDRLSKSQHLLAERDAVIKSFFENSPLIMGILEMTAGGPRSILVNQAAANFLGRTKEEIQSRTFAEFGMPPDLVELWAEKCREADKKGALVHFEYERPLGNGVKKWLSVSCGKLASAEQRFAYIIEDITDGRRAAEELQRREKLFRQLSSLAPVGIFMTDTQGRCTYVNDRLCTYTGLTEEESIGAGWADALHPDDRAHVMDAWEKAIKSRKEFELRYRYVRSNGFVVWVSCHAMAITDKSGMVTGYIGAVSNITGLKQAEERLIEMTALQRAILDSANSSIISCSPDGTIRTFNSTAERWLGYSAHEVIGKATPEIIHDPAEIKARAEALTNELGHPVEPGFESFVAKARTGEADENEWTYIRRDGSRFPVLLSVTALHGRNGEISGFLGIGRDITLQKQAEVDLLRAKDAAEQANMAKSQFLANMSHEIRTPLNGIIGVNDLLLDTGLDPEQKHFSETVRTSAESLLTIVNDILDLSKIEAGRLAFEKIDFDLPCVISDVIELLSHRASAKGLVLETEVVDDVPAHLHGDPGRLRQVLLNLVGNAIKFTERGKVRITAANARREGQHAVIRFSVIDDGIGIPPESRENVFNAFAQADNSTTRKFGGTGLGLTISRQLVEMMGGEIGLVSEPGAGSTFWFTANFMVLPAGKTAPAGRKADKKNGNGSSAAAIPPKASTRAGKYRVLLAEDSPVNQMVALHQLQKLDCDVTVAANGREAVDALRADAYDVVLMDCQMPVMDGYEATAEIRGMEGPNRDVKIIAVTANALAGEREKCLKKGMDDYLSKPFRIEELRCVLEAVMGGAPAARRTPDPAAAEPLGAEEIAQLMDESGGTDLFEKLVALFRGTASTLLLDMENACDRRDFPAIERAAHKLKGSCSNFGAKPMLSLCDRITQCVRAGQIPEVRKNLESLHEEYLRVESALLAATTGRKGEANS